MVLFRVRGIPVRLDWSWLVIFALVMLSLASAVFPTAYPGRPVATYVLMAAVATLLFFGSILVHELCHALRSLREGVRVRDITLWLFGGVSRSDEPLPGPGAEFRVVAAGPAATAVLTALFWALAVGGRAVGLSDAWVGVPDYLARINGLLLVFNLVPALPLDGGRLLHAWLWRRTGDPSTATLYAAWGGRAFAVVLLGLGVLTLVGGNTVGGFWFALLAWFLWQAVQQEERAARATRALSGLLVRDVMTSAPVTLDPDATLEQVADLVTSGPSHPFYPVVDRGDCVGVLLLQRAGRVPPGERGAVRVRDVMLTGEDAPVVHADDPVERAARVLEHEPGRAMVLSGLPGRELVGLVSVSDLAQAVAAPPRRRGSGHRPRPL